LRKNNIKHMTMAQLDKFMKEVRLVIGTHSNTSIVNSIPEMGLREGEGHTQHREG